MTVRFGTFGYTALDNGGAPMPPGNAGDIVTFNIRNILDSYRFGALGSGDVLYIAMEGEVLKVTTGGAGVLTWTAVRGQFGTKAGEHGDGAGIRESVAGPTYQSFIQNPMNAVGDLLYQAALLPPTAPVLTALTTGGTVAAATYGAKTTYIDANGVETTASSSTSITTAGATSRLTIASPPVSPGAAGWNCYLTQPGGSTYTRQNTTPLLLGAPSILTAPPISAGAAPPSTNAATAGAARLGAGTSGQVLTIDATSGLPSWIAGSRIGFQNPMTTAQDLIVGGAAGAAGRLGVGSNGQVLSVTGGVVGWSTPAASFGNPMTAAGDVIIGGAAGAATRLAKGSDNQVLTIDPTTHLPVWSNTGTTTTLQAESGGTPLSGSIQLHGTGPITISESGQVISIASSAMTNPMTTPQDLIVGGTAGAAARLGVGSNGQVLGVTSGVVGWVAGSSIGFQNPMTATGDLIVGGASGAASRKAIGATGQLLAVVGGVPTWVDNVTINGTSNHVGAASFVGALTMTGLANPTGTPLTFTIVPYGNTAMNGTYFYCVSYYNGVGETLTTTPQQVNTPTGGGVNSYVVIDTIPIGPVGTVGRNLYVAKDVAFTTFGRTVWQIPDNTTTTYTDFFGDAFGGPGPELPTANTTAGIATFGPVVLGSTLKAGGSVGTAGQVLTSTATGVAWVNSSSVGFQNPMTAAGDLILGGSAGAAGRLAKGTDGYILTMDPTTHLPVWAAAPTSGFTNPMSASGDLIYGGTAGAATRLARGTDGDVLTLVSGLPAWAVATGGGSSGTGANVNKVQLDWPLSSDIAGASGVGWTDFTGSSQSFTVDDPNSQIEIVVGGNGLIGNIVVEGASRVVIDASGANIIKNLGGGFASGGVGSYTNVLAGARSILLSGLAAGTHTVKVQYYGTSGANFYCRASSQPDTEFLNVKVIERKLVNTGTGGTLSQVVLSTANSVSYAVTTEVPVSFAAVESGIASMWASGTPTRIAISVSGMYLLDAMTHISTSAETRATMRFRKNGTTELLAQETDTTGSANYSFHLSGLVYLNAGDYVEYTIQPSSAGYLGSTLAPTDATGHRFGVTRLDGYAINPMTTTNDMIRATTGGAPERVASTGVQGSIWSTDATGKPGWNGLVTANAVLTSQVNITVVGTFVDGPSISLPAGTWLLSGQLSFYGGAGAAYNVTAKLWDGTTVYGSAEQGGSSSGRGAVAFPPRVITLLSTTTLKISATNDSNANGYITPSTTEYGSGNNACRLDAVKIA